MPGEKLMPVRCTRWSVMSVVNLMSEGAGSVVLPKACKSNKHICTYYGDS